MTRVLAALYLAAVLALAILAYLAWQLRCESFGCMGIGVAWFAWVVAFFLVLVLGAMLRARSSLGERFRVVTRSAVWVQLVLGIGLLVLWASQRVA